MLTNIVDNAVHYTLRGGSVDVSVKENDGQAMLIITDTGPGIPAAERERVFDRFYRSNVHSGEGSGLGLAIVQRIAQRHGAKVELSEGAAGRGLRVVVRFCGEPAIDAVSPGRSATSPGRTFSL
jgi:two-component system OmpR family sensor kinase